MSSKNQTSRRDFLATTGAAAAATAFLAPAIHAAGNDTIKVGIIGCGGRGKGAAQNVLQAAPGVEIVAVGDYFRNKVEDFRTNLGNFAESDRRCKDLGNKVDLPQERCHAGIEAYEQVINTPGVNYVILATPPGFRPMHLQAAVAAGKNVFTEKPVAVDGTGIRKVLDVAEEAKKKGLGVGAGTQRRHQFAYLETIKRLQDGAIGKILAGRCYWNQGNIWFRARTPGMTDLDYQIHNWYHFCWLCGDHIAEQHVHNLDVINWVTGQHPVAALGTGGRVRECEDPNVDGHIFNFFDVEYLYPDDLHVQSMCRQINFCDNNFPKQSGQAEAVVGTKGSSQINAFTINGEAVVTREQAGAAMNPYVQEHTDLIASIRAGKPLNELKGVAESTLTAIMGRMSAYTGKVVTWDQALNSKLDLVPGKFDRDMKLSADPVPVPGKTRLI